LTEAQETIDFPLNQPKNMRENPWAIQIVHADMYNAAPFSVTLKAFTQKMTMVGNFSILGSKANSTEIDIAEFTFPEISLKKGINQVKVEVNMSIINMDSCGPGNICFQVFSVAAALGAMFGAPALMKLSSDDMHLKSMGLPIPGTYDSLFNLNCTILDAKPPQCMNATGGEFDCLNLTEVPGCVEAGGCAKPAELICVPQTHHSTTVTTTESSQEFLM